ncbi:MAG: SCP2 sterol-binding domain-containing protein [Ktedonobacterales bacterium]
MATREELREALEDYVARGRVNERVRRALKNWNCVIHLQAEDVPEARFTMTIADGDLSEIKDGLASEAADLIIRGNSDDLSNVFWGDENPASNYMQGAIKVQGSQDDVMRLDAMTMFIFLDT